MYNAKLILLKKYKKIGNVNNFNRWILLREDWKYMQVNKVEICGVNTSELPVLKNKQMKELLLQIKMVMKKPDNSL